jgi:ligand-binding SRPBCC domain-containing protein
MRFIRESLIRASPERVFAFHEQPEALRLLIPPWESARVIETARISQVGARAIIETKVLGLIKIRWVAEHTEYNPPHSFEDIQVEGPFRSWRHRHIVERSEEGSLLRDEITYEPPLGFAGRLLAPWLVEKRLQRLFDYRHEITRRWCEV